MAPEESETLEWARIDGNEYYILSMVFHRDPADDQLLGLHVKDYRARNCPTTLEYFSRHPEMFPHAWEWYLTNDRESDGAATRATIIAHLRDMSKAQLEWLLGVLESVKTNPNKQELHAAKENQG